MKPLEYVNQLVQMLNRTRKRKSQYEMTFNTPSGTNVLTDLAIFCGMDRSSFDENPQIMARNEGKREVFLYINSILKKDLSDLERQIKEAQQNVNTQSSTPN